MCVTTAQRGQTICSFDVNYVQEFEKQIQNNAHAEVKIL